MISLTLLTFRESFIVTHKIFAEAYFIMKFYIACYVLTASSILAQSPAPTAISTATPIAAPTATPIAAAGGFTEFKVRWKRDPRATQSLFHDWII